MAGSPKSISAVDRAVVKEALGDGVLPLRPLVGGTHAATWLIAIKGRTSQAVLREFPAHDPWAPWEVAVLRALDGLGGLTPRVLAAGVDDSTAWILLSRLPGTSDITSNEPRTVARELGATLAQVHRVGRQRFVGFRDVREVSGGGLETLSGPAAPAVAGRWQDIIRAPHVLTHFDYWSGNVLWKGHRLTGIVDWSGGSLGPRGFDVGWCRLDLFLLYDEEIADLFLDSYAAAFGEDSDSPVLWDLWAVARSGHVETWVPNYRDLGRPDLTARVLRRRHAQWTERSLDRACQ